MQDVSSLMTSETSMGKILIFKKLRSKAEREGFIFTHFYCIFFYLSVCQYFWKCFSSPYYLGAWFPTTALNTTEVPSAPATSLVTFWAKRAQQPWTVSSLPGLATVSGILSAAITKHPSAFSKASRDTEKEATYPELRTFLSRRIRMARWSIVSQIQNEHLEQEMGLSHR